MDGIALPFSHESKGVLGMASSCQQHTFTQDFTHSGLPPPPLPIHNSTEVAWNPQNRYPSVYIKRWQAFFQMQTSGFTGHPAYVCAHSCRHQVQRRWPEFHKTLFMNSGIEVSENDHGSYSVLVFLFFSSPVI